MKFKKTILSNGLRIITVPMRGNPTVTVLLTVGTGSFYEKAEESGISHFLEHMCFKGTEKRPSARIISTELDSIGAAYNAFTSHEITGYWAKADIKHFAKIGDVVSDVFKNSIFPEKEIEKEKGVVTGEIDMYADDPQEKIGEALDKHMYQGEPASRSVLGTKETVNSITRKNLLEYRESHYVPENTVITIAGGIPQTKMLSWATKTFKDIRVLPSRPEFPTKSRVQEKPETVFIDKDTDQAHIILAWRTFDRSNPDRYIATIVRNILRSGMSSRLFIRLRDEMGSGYYIGAQHGTAKTFGNFTIATGTTHKRVPEIVSAILDEVNKMKEHLVDIEELKKVKEYMRAHVLMGLETSDDVADFCAHQEIIHGKVRTPKELDTLYAKITREEVKRVANLIFDTKKLTVAVIGKEIDKNEVKKIIGA